MTMVPRHCEPFFFSDPRNKQKKIANFSHTNKPEIRILKALVSELKVQLLVKCMRIIIGCKSSHVQRKTTNCLW
jgi:hypothetical protein